ncbi:MAG TPA: hypothetical protein VJZ51_00015 [Bacilli bacterium]|nr:hypothetical protein [Bacilli bacterium]
MKKAILVFIGGLLCLLIPYHVSADNNLPNWEFLPNGYNYLEDENFDYTVGSQTNYGIITCRNYIRIKPGVTYMLNIFNYQDAEILAVVSKAYDQNKIFMSNLQEQVVVVGEDKYYQLTPPSGAKYIDLSFDVREDMGANIGLWEVENNYSLIEAIPYSTYYNLSAAALKYQGPILDYSPVISTNNGLYITSCDNPVAMATITSAIKALDDNDGDISSQIIITKNEYVANMHIIGQYEIIYSITDSGGNSAQLSVFIRVRDTVAPVISGKNSYSTNQYTQLVASNIKSALSALDNYDGNITANIALKSNTYSDSYNIPGVYAIVFTVSDTSNNSTDFPVIITVSYNDSVAPVFTGTFNYAIANNQSLTLQDILAGIVVEDNVDGIITNKVVVEYDYYSHAPSRVGTYKIGLMVKDKMNNVAKKEIMIVVSDKTSPVFMIATQIINIDISNNNMEISDFIEFLAKTETIKQNLNYSIIEDEYSDNKNTPGTYKVLLDVEGEELELKVNVIDNLDQRIEEVDLLDLIINFFTRLWQNIVRFFKRIF